MFQPVPFFLNTPIKDDKLIYTEPMVLGGHDVIRLHRRGKGTYAVPGFYTPMSGTEYYAFTSCLRRLADFSDAELLSVPKLFNCVRKTPVILLGSDSRCTLTNTKMLPFEAFFTFTDQNAVLHVLSDRIRVDGVPIENGGMVNLLGPTKIEVWHGDEQRNPLCILYFIRPDFYYNKNCKK